MAGLNQGKVGATMISSSSNTADRALLNHPRAPAEAHNPAASDSSSVSNKTSIVRNASPPVTPPVSTGSMMTGAKARSAQKQVIPAAPKLPSSTSSTVTRVRNNSPSVPSLFSRLMLSTVRNPAQQLRRNAAMTMLWKAECPSMACRLPPNPPVSVSVRRQSSIPTSATTKRVQ